MSVLLAPSGTRSLEETLGEALEALPEENAVRVSELTTHLRDPRRAVRAQALATIAQEVALATAETTLR